MENYEPELGQSVFGQPWKQFECPEIVVKALRSIRNTMELKHIGEDHGYTPFDNSGMDYRNEVFEAHAYNWNEEEEQLYNFKWKDFEVSWYKYLGRGMSQNREIKTDELLQMVKECVASLTN